MANRHGAPPESARTTRTVIARNASGGNADKMFGTSIPSKGCILEERAPMIVTLPTQEQVDRIVSDLGPEVVHIRFNVAQDWSEHPAVYFRVILSDEATRRDRLADVTGLVREKLSDELRLADLDHIAYFRFRSRSEQAKLQDPAWD
jgi:hypothetical protein